MADSRDITGKNKRFTGTDSITLPQGTTGERNASGSSDKGKLRFNNTTNLAEYYDGTDWKAIDAPPVITGFTLDGGSDVTSAVIDASAGGNATIEVKGSLFDTTGGTVTFEGTSETLSTASIIRNSANLLTVTIARAGFDNTNEPYSIKVTNGSGLSASLADCINQNQTMTFDQSAGSLGSFFTGTAVGATALDASATDPDSETITYSVSAGSLPAGLSLNTATGFITGTPSSAGTETFTIQASTAGETITREFSITITDLPTGGSVSTSGNFRIHTYNSSSNFVNTITNLSTEYLVVAGGGGSRYDNGGGAGAGGYRCSVPGETSGGGASAESRLTLSTGTKTVTVGGGGAGGPASSGQGNSGSNSVFDTITSTGGGGGGGQNYEGRSGGSGGGDGHSPPANNVGGSGTSGQGYPGGGGRGGGNHPAGGGGGAAAAGGTPAGDSSNGGNGGSGRASSITGSSVTRAGGGAGSVTTGTSAGSAGSGGGGSGGNTNGTTGGNGSANTGGGGGGGSDSVVGGSGGSGIVIVRYDLSNV